MNCKSQAAKLSVKGLSSSGPIRRNFITILDDGAEANATRAREKSRGIVARVERTLSVPSATDKIKRVGA